MDDGDIPGHEEGRLPNLLFSMACQKYQNRKIHSYTNREEKEKPH